MYTGWNLYSDHNLPRQVGMHWNLGRGGMKRFRIQVCIPYKKFYQVAWRNGPHQHFPLQNVKEDPKHPANQGPPNPNPSSKLKKTMMSPPPCFMKKAWKKIFQECPILYLFAWLYHKIPENKFPRSRNYWKMTCKNF